MKYPIYNKREVISDVTRPCPKCNIPRGVFYVRMENGQRALALFCRCEKPKTKFIKFEELVLPEVDSIKVERKKRWEERQEISGKLF